MLLKRSSEALVRRQISYILSWKIFLSKDRRGKGKCGGT